MQPSPKRLEEWTRSAFRGVGLLAAAALVVSAAACGGGKSGAGTAQSAASGAAEGRTIRVEGFSSPESVLYDSAADVYLVSNINGQPGDKDGNGFISRVSPDGTVAQLKWIDGTAEGVTLNAPKGMAIIGDSLYVADIDCVRVFVRSTGAPAADDCIKGATFLNDIAPDGTQSLYVTDTGTGDDQPGAVYRLRPDGAYGTVTDGKQLGGANGVQVTDRGIMVASIRSGEIYRLDAEGKKTVVAPPSDRRLDGLIFLPDESFYFTSWTDSAVYHVGTDGVVSKAVENVGGPADIGFDSKRNRLLVPLLPENVVLIKDVEAPGAAKPAAPDTGGAAAGASP